MMNPNKKLINLLSPQSTFFFISEKACWNRYSTGFFTNYELRITNYEL